MVVRRRSPQHWRVARRSAVICASLMIAGTLGASAIPGTSVSIRVASADTVVAATVPSEPRDVAAVAGHNDATVSWLPPLSDGGSPIRFYSVVSTPDSGRCTTVDAALSCTVENLRNDVAYTFRVWAVNDVGISALSLPSAAVVPTRDPYGEFTALAPARVLDTRTGVGRGGIVGPLAEDAPIDVQIAGRGGVASTGVAAVVMNVTVTRPTERSYVTVWPSGVLRPESSNLNFLAGQTIPNHVTVAIGDGGRVSVVNRFGTAHVIFDVVGFYSDDPGPAGSRFHALVPFRMFDTRSGSPIGPGGTLEFNVLPSLGQGWVPISSATGVVMNVTVARATEWSYLTVYPGDLAAPPLASNLNYMPGRAVPNMVTVRVPPSGIVKFHNEFGNVHVIADVVGYFDEDRTTEAGRFIPLDPYRYFDSRYGDDPWGPDEDWLIGDFPGFGEIPVGEAAAVVLNVTATRPTERSYLSVYPGTICIEPEVSNLNFEAGQTVPNQVVTLLGQGASNCADLEDTGTIAIYNFAGSVHVIVDVFGFYTASTTTLFKAAFL